LKNSQYVLICLSNFRIKSLNLTLCLKKKMMGFSIGVTAYARDVLMTLSLGVNALHCLIMIFEPAEI